MGGAMHQQPAYRHLAHAALKECEKLGARTFFVGIHQTLEVSQIERAADVVREVLKAQ